MAENPGKFSQSVEPRFHIKSAQFKHSRSIKPQYKPKNQCRTKKPHKISQTSEISPLRSEEKKLNTSNISEAFLDASYIFGDILNQLTDFDNEEVYDRLVQIQSKIEEKISSFNILTQRKEFENSSLSKSLASSMQSLWSETSDLGCFDENAPAFKNFLSRVNCPFCSKLEQDKINLIEHIDANCRPVMINIFEERKSLPFSAIQILPNSTFKCNVCNISIKCNLKYFFAHSRSDSHMLAFGEASKSKNYTEFLFCSCCKMLVPNNYTQLDHHINHWVHKLRSKAAPNKLSRDIKKGSNCAYQKNKKFKCLDCHLPSFHNSPKDILEHFETASHVKQKKTSHVLTIFCEFCVESIHVFEVLNHFTSEKHQISEEKHEATQELCTYCAFACQSLKDLSLHMKTECQEINHLRAKYIIQTKVEPNVNKRQIKSNPFETKLQSNNYEPDKKLNIKDAELTSKCDIYEEHLIENKSDSKVKIDRQHIIVKGSTKLSELYKYFQVFGEIASIEIYEEENVLIQFRDKKAVEDVLLLRGVIKIGGLQVEISTAEDLDASAKGKEERPEDRQTNTSSDQGASFDAAENIKSRDDDLDETVMKNPEMDELFSRVSNHLYDSTRKPNDAVMQKIRNDFNKVFSAELVGFVACGLSFSVENISFYCNVPEVSSEVNSSLTSSGRFHDNLIKEYCSNFFDSSKWKNVICTYETSFPCIECTHRQTRKTCTFTFMESTKFLTDMLRRCMEKWIVQKFCVLIRFWLSVHELKIREYEYATISLIIFFLLSADVVGPFYTFQKLCPGYARQFYTSVEEQTNACDVTISSGRHITEVRELFNKFLNFLLEFDFDKYAICLPSARPIPKTLLLKWPLSSFLKFRNTDDLMRSSLCIIDPCLKVNLASGVSKGDFKYLMEIVKSNYK